jgi:hypothetical protein
MHRLALSWLWRSSPVCLFTSSKNTHRTFEVFGPRQDADTTPISGTQFHHFRPQKVSITRSAERIMARNFGVPQQIKHRGSVWPLLALTFIMLGVIDVATHLHR